MKKEIFQRYIEGSLNDTELAELIRWLEKGAKGNQEREWVREYWGMDEGSNATEDPAMYDRLLEKIHKEIDTRRKEAVEPKTGFSFKALHWFTKVAAILFIPLLVGISLLLVRVTPRTTSEKLAVDILTISAYNGSQTKLTLPDGTQAYLNSGTTLHYPSKFSGGKREVSLDGEGYFEVVTNPDMPFVVKADKVQVMALGTTFNVRAYATEGQVSTTLVDGKVVLKNGEADPADQPIASLEPGEQVIYDVDSKAVTKQAVNIHTYVDWIHGKLVFNRTPMSRVAEELERRFNVDLEISNNVKDFTYTVTLTDEPLYFVLDMMTETTPITYRILPRKKNPDGTMAKQKIQIGKR